MSLTVLTIAPKNQRTLVVTLEGPTPGSVNETAAKQLALDAAAQAGHSGLAVRRMLGVFPYHPDGTRHEGNEALPAGTTWRQTFELEAGL